MSKKFAFLFPGQGAQYVGMGKDFYDTYKAVGLAPGAYCSPSIDSIKAALNPDAACNAYYFVTDKNMKYYYNEDYSGHKSIINQLKRNGLWAS